MNKKMIKNGIPGEYEKHYGTIAMYPIRNDIWRDDAYHMQKYIINLIVIISKYEKVLFVCPKEHISKIKNQLPKEVDCISIKYDDIWSRDIAPTFTYKNGELCCIDWKFNSWGGKKEGSYFPWDMDDQFASKISNYLGKKCSRVNIVLEGGAIISDGNGTLFTTRSVLLNRNRNPFKTKEEIEKNILEATGDKKIVWLKRGLFMDETNGHIDNLLSFISPLEMCLAWTDDKHNPNYKRVREAYGILQRCTNLYGEKYKIHLIPLPSMQYMKKEESNGLENADFSLERNAGDILPASYLNFYLLNGAVIIPSFGCEEDEIVFKKFKEIFQDRDIIQIYSREPLLGGGGIHCILHEIPILEDEK